jgi:hypothetical protein
MATVLHALTLLSEGSASRRAGLPFLVASLQANGWELELDATTAETAAGVRASPLGRLFARVAELAQSSIPSEVEDAAVVLATCMASGACGEKGLEAFWKQWVVCVTAFLQPRQGWAARGRGCSCFAFILHAVHAVGKDTHVGREVGAALTGLLPSLVRVLDAAGDEAGVPLSSRAPDASTAALGTALCLEAWRALLVFTPQAVRPHAHRLTARCLADLDCTRGNVLSTLAQECLALLCYQVRLVWGRARGCCRCGR